MTRKPSYEALQRRIASLEIENTARDVEIENLRKTCEHAKRELTRHVDNPFETNQRIKKDLKTSQHLLQMLMDTIEGEAFIKDVNGNYLYVNKAFGRDFGVDPKEVIGKDDFFVFSAKTAAQLQ